jgi:ABC-type antimicrobial peptide transport system ATPase subunit
MKKGVFKMMEMLHEQLINLAIILLVGFVGWVTKTATGYLKKKGLVSQLESHKQLVNLVVNGVEQAYTHLHGKEKLNMAKIEVIKLANSKGVKISANDLDMLIENAVKEMNSTIKESLK